MALKALPIALNRLEKKYPDGSVNADAGGDLKRDAERLQVVQNVTIGVQRLMTSCLL